MSAEWDDYAVDWDSNPQVCEYARRAFGSWQSRVAPVMGDLAATRILDFGCGTGLLAEQLAPLCRTVVAADASAKMIEVLQQKLASQAAANVEPMHLPSMARLSAYVAAPEDRFDAILASSVCSFLDDYNGTLQELALLLQPGGYFVQWDWATEMPRERIEAAFTAADLTVHAIECPFSMDAADVIMATGCSAI